MGSEEELIPISHLLYYVEGQRDPGAMLAQGSMPHVPAVGATVHLSDGFNGGFWVVVDVVYHGNVHFAAEIGELSEGIETGNDRPKTKVGNRVSVFLRRTNPVFDKVPLDFPVDI